MKNLITFIIVVGLILQFQSANAQSQQKNKDSGNVAERIGNGFDNADKETDKDGNNIDDEANRTGNGIDKETNNFGEVFDKVGNNIDRIVNKTIERWTSPYDDKQTTDDDSVTSTIRHSPDVTDSEIDSNAQSFTGGKVIEESETVTGNVIVKGGDLTIYGKVDGDVEVVGGDLHMKRTGKITGSARVVNGSILKEEGAVIAGSENYRQKEKSSFRPSRRKISRTVRTFDVPWSNEKNYLDNFIFRYNRVEGMFLGLGSEKKYYWDGERSWNMYGFAGWGFKSHTWRGSLGLARQFAILTNEGSGIIELGAEGYSLTDTKDNWIISHHENTAAALFIHEDFRDYFERNGYTLHLAYYSKNDYLKNELKIEYLVDAYDSLTNKVDWALFGGGKWFRTNPAINPGKMRSIIASGGVSTISNTSYGSEGWSLNISAEFAKKNWGSEFEFDQYILDLRRFQPLGRYDNFNIRLRAGSLVGDMLTQKVFDLGGLGTMNAFPFKSQTGNRMLLINAELIVNGSFLDDFDFWPTWIFRNINFVIMSDAGLTRNASPTASML